MKFHGDSFVFVLSFLRPTIRNQQCLATIASVYWRSNEESVESERPVQTPPREYSDMILSNSRVDKVHARKWRSEGMVH